jgi:hypothetical protein
VIIILAALGVILAAVTLFVGILAIYGYSAISDLAVRAAQATAQTTAQAVAPAAAAREVEAMASREQTGQPSADLVAALQERADHPGDQNGT